MLNPQHCESAKMDESEVNGIQKSVVVGVQYVILV